MSNYAERIEQCALADAGAVRLANATTGAEDTNVPDAIASLIAGYGGGGSGFLPDLPDSGADIWFTTFNPLQDLLNSVYVIHTGTLTVEHGTLNGSSFEKLGQTILAPNQSEIPLDGLPSITVHRIVFASSVTEFEFRARPGLAANTFIASPVVDISIPDGASLPFAYGWQYTTYFGHAMLQRFKVHDLRKWNGIIGAYNPVYSLIKRIEIYGGALTSGSFRLGSSCQALDTVIMQNVDASVMTSANDGMLSNCYCLRNVDFTGSVLPSSSDINMSNSAILTKESAISIFNALPTTDTQRTIRLHNNVKNLLSDADKAIATSKNWKIN